MIIPGVVSGPGSLTKTTGGTLTLQAANTYTGGNTSNGGTLARHQSRRLGRLDGQSFRE